MKMSVLIEELQNAGVQNWVAITAEIQKIPPGTHLTLMARLPLETINGDRAVGGLGIECYREGEDDFTIKNFHGKKLFRTITEKFLDAVDGLD